MGANLKEISQRQIYNQLNATLNYAVKYYDLPKNPCKVTGSIGRLKADRVGFWTTEEFNSFISKIDDITLNTAFNTLYYTGIRCGELLANVKDIDLKSRTISISKTYYRHEKKDMITSPKTGSRRIVTIPIFLVDCIKDFINKNYGITPEDLGFSPYLIAERIGDSVDMVNNIYGHLYPNRHTEVADKLQQLVSN